MIKATCREKHLVEGLLTVSEGYFMTIIMRRMGAGRQAVMVMEQ